jgi:hypothetical protein
MIFNGLDRPFELSNSRYIHEVREVLWFTKHHNLTIYMYIAMYYLYISGDVLNLSYIHKYLISRSGIHFLIIITSEI